jgi:hypothetical protein
LDRCGPRSAKQDVGCLGHRVGGEATMMSQLHPIDARPQSETACPWGPMFDPGARTTPADGPLPPGRRPRWRSLAATAADQDWPDSLRAEGQHGVDDGLNVEDLTDPTIVTALNKQIVDRDAKRRLLQLQQRSQGLHLRENRLRMRLGGELRCAPVPRRVQAASVRR